MMILVLVLVLYGLVFLGGVVLPEPSLFWPNAAFVGLVQIRRAALGHEEKWLLLRRWGQGLLLQTKLEYVQV